MNKDQLAELEMLRMEAGGELKPARILEFARSSNTALHSAFTWDDTEAADRFRLHQARQVIRAAVTMLPRPDGGLVPVRAYVFDQTRDAYASTAAVLAEEDRAAALLGQMRAEVQRTLSRYRRYAELAPQIAATMAALEGQAQQMEAA